MHSHDVESRSSAFKSAIPVVIAMLPLRRHLASAARSLTTACRVRAAGSAVGLETLAVVALGALGLSPELNDASEFVAEHSCERAV